MRQMILTLLTLLITPSFLIAAETKPNIIVILCDDLGYGDLSCYGHPHIKTPNLDKMAAEGMRCTDFYSTSPVCSPSRVGLLTGRTPNRAGVYDWIPPGHPAHLREHEVTIPALLKTANYDTLQSGKWHCNGRFNVKDTPQPDTAGFNHWFATQNNAAPRHKNPVNFVRNRKPVGKLEGFSCQIVVDETIEWLKNGRDKSKPFFSFVCFHEPHEPVESPTEMAKAYLDAGVAKSMDEAQYFANVENLDKAAGRFLKFLDDEKLSKDTLVIFTSDNGPETLNRYRSANRSFGRPGPLRGMKLHIYDGGIRVAGIIRWPGHVKAGVTSNEPVCALDLLPTFCELAGVKPPQDLTLDGTSFTSLLDGKPVKRENPLFWWYYRSLSKPRVAMRDGDWKIVAHVDGPFTGGISRDLGGNVNEKSMAAIKTAKVVSFELYNMAKDIAEKNDLSKEQPEILEKLKKQLLEKYTEVQAEGPTWEFGKKAGKK